MKFGTTILSREKEDPGCFFWSGEQLQSKKYHHHGVLKQTENPRGTHSPLNHDCERKNISAQIHWFWSNYSDLTRPGPPNGGLGREFLLFQGIPCW